MKDLVDRRQKGKVATSSLGSAMLKSSVHIVQKENQKGSPTRNLFGRREEKRGIKNGPTFNKEGQQALADHLWDQTGWNCLLFISAAGTSLCGSWNTGECVKTLATGDA